MKNEPQGLGFPAMGPQLHDLPCRCLSVHIYKTGLILVTNSTRLTGMTPLQQLLTHNKH